jgi:hypothetical protein
MCMQHTAVHDSSDTPDTTKDAAALTSTHRSHLLAEVPDVVICCIHSQVGHVHLQATASAAVLGSRARMLVPRSSHHRDRPVQAQLLQRCGKTAMLELTGTGNNMHCWANHAHVCACKSSPDLQDGDFYLMCPPLCRVAVGSWGLGSWVQHPWLVHHLLACPASNNSTALLLFSHPLGR